MRLFPDALSTVRTAVHSGADLKTLRACTLALAACCPGSSPDLIDVVNGLIALLDFYEEPYDNEVLAAQVLGELESIEFLVEGDAVDAEWDTADVDIPIAEPLFDEAALLEFRESHHERLDRIEQLVAQGPTDLDEIKRLIHTLKGDAGTVGAPQLEAAYHETEDRLGRIDVPEDSADLLLAVCDWARDASTEASLGLPPDTRHPEWPESETASPEEPTPAFESAPEPNAVVTPELASAVPAPPPAAPAPPATSQNSDYEPITLSGPVDSETLALFGDFYAESVDNLTHADDLLVQSEQGEPDPENIDALFRIFHTIKGLAGFLEFRHIAELAHATEARLDTARNDIRAFDDLMADLLLRSTAMMKVLMEGRRELYENNTPFIPPKGLHQLIAAMRNEAPLPADLPMPTVGGDDAEDGGEAEDKPTKSSTPRLSVVRETIKVDLARVDKLVETIGELVIMEAMVTQSVHRQSRASQQTQYQMSQMSKVVRDLQRQGLALRMVPLRGVFGKMSRLVRDLSRKSSKEVRLELSGQDAEMDRSLAERLGDPLVHMVRNAVDHGVESPEDRVAAGKPRHGTLRLSAYHEGGNIVIELADDGKGLDRERIVAKALERELISDPNALSDREVWELIFHPGFSTAAQVTEISGRGVGMDVVKKTIEDLRGRIQIDSTPGKGTTFRFLLPLTLAIIDGMLLACGKERYVLPTLAIEESIQPTDDQLHRFGADGMMLNVRGETLPLVNLAGILNIDAKSRNNPVQGLVMLVDGVNGRFGLVVDDVIGQQQVVIKNLSESVNRSELFSGAAILSDGQVGLILNTTGLGPTRSPVRGVSHAC